MSPAQLFELSSVNGQKSVNAGAGVVKRLGHVLPVVIVEDENASGFEQAP